MHARFGAALIGAVLAFAPGPLAASVDATTWAPSTAPAPARIADPDCPIGNICVRYTFVPLGNGSGRFQTTNSSHVPDGLVDCVQTLGVIQDPSKCTHLYDTGSTGVVVVYHMITTAIGSFVCDSPTECKEGVFYGHNEITSDFFPTTTFQLKTFTLAVTRGGSGSGSVFSTPPAIGCGSTCQATLDYGTSILLTAIPATGSTFSGWTGACTGQPKDCLIAIIANTATEARFTAIAGATVRPGTPAPPRATAGPPSAPAVTVGPEPGSSVEVSAAPAPPTVSSIPAASSTPTPSLSPEPTAEAGDSGTGLIAILILGVGALIALGIVVVGLRLRRPTGRLG